MTQVADDRDCGGGCGLAVKRCFRPLRQHAELGELRRQQLLVRRDHRLSRGERGDEDRLDRLSSGRFDDDINLGVADQVETAVGDWNANRPRTAILVHVPHRDPRHAELHAVPIGNRTALAIDHFEQAAADGAAADQADADLADRLDADAFEARARGGLERLAKRAGASQQIGEAVLIGEKRIVAEQRFELPQRRVRARRLQRAVQLHLEGPRKQHVAGHADDDRLGVDAADRVAHRLRIAHRFAIDRLAQQQERLDRKAFGKAPPVVIEILGDRRPIEMRQQLAKPRVELVAAAIRQHPELARAHHAGGDIAIAKPVAHQLALQVPRRRAPAIRAQSRGNGDQLGAAIRMPCREQHADHAAEAGADPRHRHRAAAAIQPCGHEVREAGHRNRFG